MTGLESLDLEVFLGGAGVWMLAPLAVVEGPVVAIIATALAKRGVLELGQVLLLLLGDLAGDLLLYALGRLVPGAMTRALARRRRPDDEKQLALEAMFHAAGGRALIVGKLTHFAGFAVLLAAGIAKMPLGRFVLSALPARAG